MKETKIKIVITTRNESDEIIENGYISDNELKLHSSTTKSSYFLYFQEEKIIKIDKDKEIELDFKNKNIVVSTNNTTTKINIDVQKYRIIGNKIEITYLIEEEVYNITIEWKV